LNLIARNIIQRPLFWVVLSLLLVGCVGQGSSWAGVSATEDRSEIFVSHGKFIAKLAPDGERLWTYPPEESRDANIYASVSISDDAVYVGDYAGNVFAIDRQTGEGIWAYEVSGTSLFGFASFGGSTNRVIGGIAVGEDVLYVPSEEGVFLLDRETGVLRDDWELETTRGVWSQPLYIDGDAPRLYVTSLDHNIYAIQPISGEIIWKTDLNGAAPGSPVYDEEHDVLFVGTFNSEVVAVNAEDGAIINRYEANGWVWEPPAVEDNNLYFSDLDGYLYAVRYDDGQFQELWNRQITLEGKLRATPLVTDDLVIVGSGGERIIYAVERETGNEEWSQPVSSRAISTLIEVPDDDEMLVVTALDSSDELVVGLRLDNGNVRWSYEHRDD
jgi:outer membrane protein assembly factor BamB